MPRENNNREYIFNEAVRLFCEQGYEATTIRQIANAAHVQGASIYFYFENKEAILDEIFRVLRVKPKSYISTQNKIDAYLKTDTPTQLLSRFIPSCKAEDAVFMSQAYRIAHTEQFINPKASELVRGYLIGEAAESLKYALDRLMESHLISEIDTQVFSEIWACNMFIRISIDGFPEADGKITDEDGIVFMGEQLITMLLMDKDPETQDVNAAI